MKELYLVKPSISSVRLMIIYDLRWKFIFNFKSILTCWTVYSIVKKTVNRIDVLLWVIYYCSFDLFMSKLLNSFVIFYIFITKYFLKGLSRKIRGMIDRQIIIAARMVMAKVFFNLVGLFPKYCITFIFQMKIDCHSVIYFISFYFLERYPEDK
jgi:hypothetical protein